MHFLSTYNAYEYTKKRVLVLKTLSVHGEVHMNSSWVWQKSIWSTRCDQYVQFLDTCFSTSASLGSKSHFCELSQGEVCSLAVFPHADVWGRAGSIFRICPSFFQEPPLSAPSNQAAEANASRIGREGWTEAVTQKVGLKKLTWQRYLIVWGQRREHSVRERNSGKQTCGVAPVTFPSRAAYRQGF